MPVEEKNNQEKEAGWVLFRGIEAAWLALSAHRQLYGCSEAKVIPAEGRTFWVHCRVHGHLQPEGQAAPADARP